MNDIPVSVDELQTLFGTVRENLLSAQKILDRIVPDSIIGARLQHVLDDLEDVTMADIARGRRGNRLD